jgi:hypothetical protein
MNQITHIEKKNTGNLSLWFGLFVFLSIIVFCAQNFLPLSDFLEGLFIPDTVNISNTFDNLFRGGSSLISTGLVGVYFIYYLAWITNPAFSLLINLIFVYFSFKLIQEIFINNNLTSQIVSLGMFVNPYIFFAITGPNKEIPLIWGTLYIVRNLISKKKKWFIKSIIISFVIATVREGYGVILFLSIIIFSLKISVNFMWKIGILVAFSLSIVTDFLLSYLSILEKNLIIAQSIGSDANSSNFVGDFLNQNSNPAFSIIKEIIRMLYNWLTLSAFPIFFTESGYVYSLGFGYWIFGVFISICLLATLYILFTNRGKSLIEVNQLKIAGVVLFIWSTTSISLFVQPRYLIPVLPLAFGLLMSMRKMSRRLCVLFMIFFSFSIMLTYSFLGIPRSKISIDDSIEGSVKSDPSFLIFSTNN